jgi:hypothetical protein
MAGVVLVKSPNDKPGVLAPAGSFVRHTYPSTPGPVSASDNDAFLRASPRYQWIGDPADKTQWSECNVANLPGDRRIVLADSDYVFTKGSTAVYVFALVASPPANNNGCPTASATSIIQVADTALARFGFPVSVPEIAAEAKELVYPNPATSTLFIDAAITAGHLMIYDATGRKFQAVVRTGSKQTEIDITNLAPGLYNIVYFDKGVMSSGKFIKE